MVCRTLSEGRLERYLEEHGYAFEHEPTWA